MRFSAKLVTVLSLLVLFQLFFPSVRSQAQNTTEVDGLKSARSLVYAINQYRREKGLSEIPYSSWLTYVARYHVYDLEVNKPHGGSCSQHSWSNKGKWSPCCYVLSKPSGECMWSKPKELSKGAYKSNGFEISVHNPGGITIPMALESWKGSKPHLNVILNGGIWSDSKWKAIGAGVSEHYAVVWFGEEADSSK